MFITVVVVLFLLLQHVRNWIEAKVNEMKQKLTQVKRRREVEVKKMTTRKRVRKDNKSLGEEPVEVDTECAQLRGLAKVYVDEKGRCYSTMLSQTNIQQNNNKFYLIQLLHNQTAEKDEELWVWLRWGRVGFKGQTNLVPFGSDLDGALVMFHNKFMDKTQNDFRAGITMFRKIAGKYDLIKIDYTRKTVIDKENQAEEGQNVPSSPIKKMDERVRNLLNTICDLKTMERDAGRLEYDFKRIPLGQITKEQLHFGYEALGRIERHIQKRTFGKEFMEAMNDYYTRIPHSFGMRTPPPIKSPEELKRENELLEMLTGIEITVSNIGADPLECHYARLRWDLFPLERQHVNFKIVEEYLQGTHGPTHGNYRMKLRNVFELRAKEASNEEENGIGRRRKGVKDNDNGTQHKEESFRSAKQSVGKRKNKNSRSRKTEEEEIIGTDDRKNELCTGNRKLLWHGSRLANWYSILAKGLRIAPPEAPSTGFMFGKGVYFADISSKSANYSLSEPGKPGFLLLSVVSLGEMVKMRDADSKMHQRLPEGKHSVRGVGRYVPNPNKGKIMDGDVEVPCGRPIQNAEVTAEDDTSLIYNEFVVYDLGQIQERFLVEVEYELKFVL